MPINSKPLLVLVDGSSYLYRAYHALPALSSHSGFPTGAMVGVLNMLRRLEHDYKPDYLACIFDAKGPTFRHELYPDYKSHRPPMPEDLVQQIQPLHEIIQALGWPLLVEAGVEADDVIGTLAKTAVAQGAEVLVSTGDKDMVQLIQPHVQLINTMTNERLDEESACNKYGIHPRQFVDYLTLIGDSADNVPGVHKVGPKTAQKWIAEFDSLEHIMAHADNIKGALGERLKEALTWLPQARELLTIRCDVKLPVALNDLIKGERQEASLVQLAKKYDLRQLIREDDISVPSPPPARQPPPEEHKSVVAQKQYDTLLTWPAFDLWFDKIKGAQLTALDTETTSLDPFAARLVGLSFSISPHEAAYLPLQHCGPDQVDQLPIKEVLEKLKPWLESDEHKKVGQHLKYDTHVLANHGIHLRGVAHDTLLESYVLESHLPHNLDSLAKRHLGENTTSYESITGKGARAIGFEQVAITDASHYAAEDADITLRIHQRLSSALTAQTKLNDIYQHIELPMQNILWRMEREGVLIDATLLQQQSDRLGQQLMEIEADVHQLAGLPFNLNSPKQIQEILFQQLHLPILKKTPKGEASTDESVLQELALDYPIAKQLLFHRSLSKLKSTYTDKLPRMINPETHRVHTHYAQAVAVTGRLSSSDPNLQNIPIRTVEGRRIREAFIAGPNKLLVSADYSQIELRIMAHLSEDEGLVNAFTQGLDVHSATAAEIFGVPAKEVSDEQRRAAKAINFGLIYGMSAYGLAKQINCERGAAQAYMDRYFQRYPGVLRYMNETRAKAKQQGFVETVLGRRLWLPDISLSNAMRRQGAERAAINAPMQGTAADLIKLAMIAVDQALHDQRLTTKLIMQVHDELILEVPHHEQEVIKELLPRSMENVMTLNVPLKVEMGWGNNWDAAH
ncbi:MAG: DNA polymerase I [Ferrovum sp. 37-45-19]|nr:MAG: DNA polymerase I [Ferrovum sp. 21-44-67]OYV94777.1 MAG: DNA polymerase I [Ferrovum sp. 37-45-19]HQT81103.1 DNA polymerase I [Ferrovaceae bacterium]HQU06080.1 DNA polymerase I [Ferrovaceae bacterium]